MDWNALFLTMRLAVIVAGVLLIIGVPIAYWITYSRWRWKFLIEAQVALPLVLPPTVLGFYLLVALGSRCPIASGGNPSPDTLWLSRLTDWSSATRLACVCRSLECPVRCDHKITVKRAMGILGCRWTKLLCPDPSSCLPLDLIHHLWNRDAVTIKRLMGVSAKITDWLKMYSADGRHSCQRIVDDPANICGIYTGDECRYQHNSQALFGAMRDRRRFCFKQGCPADRTVDCVVGAIKLQEHATQSSLFQTPHIAGIASESEAIRIQLKKAEAQRPSERNDFRQVVAQCGFAA
jgi:hypothetical protein